MHGSLRSFKNNDVCFSNGLFLHADIDSVKIDAGIKLYSEHLAPIFGFNELNLENSIDMGYYIDFSRSQFNGFFARGDVYVSLFDVFKLKISTELTFISSSELKQRIDSLKVCSLVSPDQLTPLNKYLVEQKYETLASKNFSFYFIGHLKAKQSLNFPLLLNLLDIKGHIEGIYALPNPFDLNSNVFMEFHVDAKFLGSLFC
jgi:hypothetical protein